MIKTPIVCLNYNINRDDTNEEEDGMLIVKSSLAEGFFIFTI